MFACLCSGLCGVAGIEAQQLEPIPFEQWDEWRLSTDDGASLFIREVGHGATVLILHGGWGAEHSYLIDPFIALAADYHLIFYDQRGSLRSQCPDSLVSVANHIEDLERIRIAIREEKLILIGHSMGGLLGMSYLQKYPDRVKGLVLIASAPAQGSIDKLTVDIQASALQRWERPEVIDTLSANGLGLQIQKDYSDKQRGTWHRITFAAINLHHVKHWRTMRSAFFYQSAAAARAAASGPVEWDFRPDLAKAHFTVTLLHGDDDYLPLDYHRQSIQEIPNVTLKVINDAGHLCWIDRPEEFSHLLKEALRAYR